MPTDSLTAPRARIPIRWIIGFGALIAAGIVLHGLLHGLAAELDYHVLMRALRHVRADAIGQSLLWTAVSFVALVARDATALRYVGAKPPLSAILLAGFCGTALGNAVGFGTLTGGAVRYRIYTAAKVKPDDVARVMVFIAISFGIGLALIGGGCVFATAGPIGRMIGWRADWLRAGAAVVVLVTAAGLGFASLARVKLPWLDRKPSLGLSTAQLVITAIDLIAAAAGLWVLLPDADLGFWIFTAAFIAATAVGVLSHVPGGIGVFEAFILLAIGHRVTPDGAAAALVAYRGIYFILPLIVSAALLAAFEVRLLAGGKVSVVSQFLAREAARLTPRFLGVLIFAAGAMLLVSGATPAYEHRLALLSVNLPLWLLEASHFLGSLAGVLLLFVARGLANRLDGAWWVAVVLTIASLVFSLCKGLAYFEASFLAFLLLLLIATRRQFKRRASLIWQPFTVGWFVAIGLILAASIWILFFAFHDVEYTHDLWWEFEFDAQAPRALRAILGACVLAAALGLGKLLTLPKGKTTLPSKAELAQAAAIIRAQEKPQAMLALMGDKSLMFSDSGQSLLMYAQRGRSWIALFDPVGPRHEWQELIWRFIESASFHGSRAAFYQVQPSSLPLYLDAGLKIMKLGEEAVVSLADFSLAGGERANLRYALKRGEREGLTFEMIPQAQGTGIQATLKKISEQWRAKRRTAEYGFSVAAFVPDFVAATSIALVRLHGEPVAFLTVMHTDTKHEATIGLMRHLATAPSCTMEFLFTSLILYLKSEGYAALSLGMAPFSGLTKLPLTSQWHRIGRMIWQHGNTLYNFQGLRLFKGKFHPVWEPRYLAASGTIEPFVALIDVAALIGTPIRPVRIA